MNVLLFGSSIIRKWNNFTLKMEVENIMNKGISGLHTKELLSNNVMKFLYVEPPPNYLVFYCGSNDILSNVPVNEIEYNLQRFLVKLTKLYKNTTIIVLSLIKSPKLVQLGKTNQINLVNAFLRDFCKKYSNLCFINTNLLLNEEHCFLADGLHISSYGYKKINKKIIDIL